MDTRLGICFKREPISWMQDQWSFVFSNFGVTQLWERGDISVGEKIYQPTIKINLASELPSERPLIVVNPKDAKYIKGNVNLKDFEHPEDAIYLFGGAHINLNKEEDLGSRIPDETVFIPSVKHEMYPHAAGYIVLYDRFLKRGDFG